MMAEVVTGYKFSGKRKFPWELWLNGQQWRLSQGTREQVRRGERDFSSDAATFRSSALNFAWRNNMNVATAVLPDKKTVIIQFLGYDHPVPGIQGGVMDFLVQVKNHDREGVLFFTNDEMGQTGLEELTSWLREIITVNDTSGLGPLVEGIWLLDLSKEEKLREVKLGYVHRVTEGEVLYDKYSLMICGEELTQFEVQYSG